MRLVKCRSFAMVATCLCLALNLHSGHANPAMNTSDYLELFKYERHLRNDETTTTAVGSTIETTHSPGQEHKSRSSDHHHSDSDLYTLQLGQHNQRQLKHDDIEVYDYKCPKQHHIHPCDCLGILYCSIGIMYN